MKILNKKQKITATVFVAILTLMCLFPPTRVTESRQNYDLYKGISYHETISSSGFRFIGHLGTEVHPYSPKKSYSIDTAQLFLQVLVACLAGVAMLYVFNEPQKKD